MTKTKPAATAEATTSAVATTEQPPFHDASNNEKKRKASVVVESSNRKSRRGAVSASFQTTVSFLRPTTQKQQLLQFPPTIYLNATYHQGIALPHPVTFDANNNSSSDSVVETLVDRPYYIASSSSSSSASSSGNHEQDSPCCLSPMDAQLWFHKYAADASVKAYFPVQVGRLLGTITRRIVAVNKKNDGNKKKKKKKKSIKTPQSYIPKTTPPKPLVHQKLNNITKYQSIKEARKQIDNNDDDSQLVFESPKQYEQAVQQRAQQLRDAWADKLQRNGRLMTKEEEEEEEEVPPCWWDGKYGHLLPERMNDSQYVPVVALLRFMKQATDLHANETCRLYNGLREIPTDTCSVLQSLAEMSSPKGLYQIPLLFPYPRVTLEEESTTTTTCTTTTTGQQQQCVYYKIQIGVYAHRLLPEIMTERDLHIVMSALDAGSYRVTEPLHLPPTASNNVFESNPLPRVEIPTTTKQQQDEEVAVSGDDDDDVLSIDSSSNDTKPAAAATTSTTTTIDLTIEDSTRDDESSISAFTVKGLMKLLESKGNDVSNWPAIESKLDGKFRLPLMLHQQHAICWMHQMEHLGGRFGLNSMIWEEREFLDSGKYYYSPALGQIRLERPHFMRGGLLCDEMGLGKTMEILGLILATMEETKQEAQQARDSGEYDPSIIHMHGTLIIVPPALVFQWESEIIKAAGDSLGVEFYDHKNGGRFINRKQPGEHMNHYVSQPDIVITTYQALEKPASVRMLSGRSWGRIVLDEMQEIRSSTTTIAKNCDKLLCQRRRWMVSGTPLFEGVDDLRGELNFLSLDPFCAKNEDGFFNYSVLNHWNQESVHGLETLRILGLLLLRRSKDMTIVSTQQPLLGLKPLTVEFVPVPQRPSERALYCFLEYIVAEELATLDNDNTKDGNLRRTCLRLLREMCVSTVLLNGGMGVSSQLQALNNLLVRKNRRSLVGIGDAPKTEESDGSSTGTRVFSCEEAIRYLSQVQEEVVTDGDFVSDLALGTGGGMAQRNRATESLQQKVAAAKDKLAKATKVIDEERSKRARARWHYALERITTGNYPKYSASIDQSFVGLWRFRYALIEQAQQGATTAHSTFPSLLLRGWRPSSTFLQDIRASHPDFMWSQPAALQLRGIPREVTVHEVESALCAVLSEQDDKNFDVPDMVAYKLEETWNAFISFGSVEDAQLVGKKAASKDGIELKCEKVIPSVAKTLNDAQAAFDQAEAEHEIYPTQLSTEKLRKMKKALAMARLGLRIFAGNKEHSDHNVELSRALRICRTLVPSTSQALLRATSDAIDNSNHLLAENIIIRNEALADAHLYEQASEISDEVKKMSAYEALQALSSKDANESTWCPICMGNLGSTEKKGETKKYGLVVLTSCGHLFCRACLDSYRQSRQRDGMSVPCPTCRKHLDAINKTILVDPSLTRDEDDLEKKRIRAKEVIQRAASMLHSSNGQLPPDIWEQIYLSFDLPHAVSKRGDTRLTATPKEVLQHLRAATGMETNSKPSVPGVISSKIEALINDLPHNERSVVFSSSLISVKHLLCCLKSRGLAFQALYTGQKIEAQEHALEAWKAADLSCPILVVQSGAAASGLTLTAASKMFLLEPFVRHEEEKQAYARCHRYGQEKPVHVKIYYAPVSVESRLLTWRKKSSSEGVQSDATIMYSTMDVDKDDGYDHEEKKEEEESEDLEGEDTDQTLFLLGLK